MQFGEHYSEVLQISSLKHLWEGSINDEDAIFFVVLTMYVLRYIPNNKKIDQLLLSKEAIDSNFDDFKKNINHLNKDGKKVIERYLSILTSFDMSPSIIRRFTDYPFCNQKIQEKDYFYMLYKVGTILEKSTQKSYFFMPYSLLSFVQNILFANFMENGFPTHISINDLSPICSSIPHFLQQQIRKFKKSIQIDILNPNADFYSYVYSLITASLFRNKTIKKQYKEYDIILMLTNNFKELEKNNKTLNPKILNVIAGVSKKLKNNKSIAIFLIPVTYLSTIIIREKSSIVLENVESIILLPPKLFLDENLPQALLIVRKNKLKDDYIKILDLDESKYLCVNCSQAFSPKIYFKKQTLLNFTFKENSQCFLQYERVKKTEIYDFINKYKTKYPPYYSDQTI